jgi:hypothetical protein
VFKLSQEHQMGITLSTFSGLLAPLQQFAGWLASAPARSRPRGGAMRATASPATRSASGRAHGSWRAATRARPLRRPVRVVRVVDACQAPAHAGRMVISGRMADVCAELERLAALEAEPC